MTDPLNGWKAVEAFFGEPWPSGICETGIQKATPVGQRCWLCEELVLYGQQGSWIRAFSQVRHGDVDVPVHRECLMRQVVGSIEHLTGRCKCRAPQGLGDLGWSPAGTFREQAMATWAWLEARRFDIPEARPAGRPD